ncbi:MAG: pilus assembly protein CpaA [Mesorhizobium sp.]|uniref:A24 family peptidase n=1 Tax=Mesorhizobium sp. TaxID=1871066 RepID=UPI0012196573|nr:prepilin peptidase [Mesorhizobium sp.]TIO48393.1 MAG: pilus assembly protein CpaA [Mesorhizobium sp.]TIO56744.1 MAG: pilus assembly protein CpaA [Mesorhizobium sp.]TJV58395.1 MAG: pilus assembly protein CpaA [Mesorhizobium sp.]
MISMSAAWIALLLFAGGIIYAALNDVMTMTIGNRLVLVLAGAYLILAPAAGIGPDAILSSVAVAAAVLVSTFVLFAFGWIGGGDAKLAAVAVLWLGPDLALPYVLYASVFGAFLTLALLQYRRMPLPVFLRDLGWPGRAHATGAGVPYGVALALAALLLLPQSHWLVTII